MPEKTSVVYTKLRYLNILSNNRKYVREYTRECPKMAIANKWLNEATKRHQPEH